MHTCALWLYARHASQSNSVTDFYVIYQCMQPCRSPGNLCIMAISCVQTAHLPERATMSVLLSPFLEKAARRSLRLELGPGRSLLAKDALAVVASLLPSRTVHDGPPSCADGTIGIFTQAQEGNREL